MKKGTQTHLAVTFDIPLADVKRIEFMFTDSSKKVVKTATYPGIVEKDVLTETLYVPFTQIETMRLSPTIYMDTRITLNDSDDQPETPIIKLRIHDTLFGV